MHNIFKDPIFLAKPKRYVGGPWFEHIPFGMYLVSVLKPKLLVELGAYRGDSYCAFCQAVSELSLDTRCFAIDTWEGDVHAGFYGPELLDELKKYHNPLYGEFSQLMQSTFDDALRHFSDKTIDLLHIDGCHRYEDVKNDFESWLPKVSPEGVILFHDINVRERDFGVWKLWEELKLRYRTFEFLHGHGLGVLALGNNYNEQFESLLNLSDEEAVHIRELFYLLGNRITILKQIEIKDQQIEIKDQDRINLSLSFDTKLKESYQTIEELNKHIVNNNQNIKELNEAIISLQTAKRELEEQTINTANNLEEIKNCLIYKTYDKDLLDVEIQKIKTSLSWKIREKLLNAYNFLPLSVKKLLTASLRTLLRLNEKNKIVLEPSNVNEVALPETFPEEVNKLRSHVIITGTGRAGTTFLVQLLTTLGLDTGFNELNEHINPHSRGGLELDIRADDAPYIVKSPWIIDYLEEVLVNNVCKIDHAFIPIRDLFSATASRVRVSESRDVNLFPVPQDAPGGLWYTNDPEKQSEILTKKFYDLIQILTKYEVPYTLLDFPRIVEDCDYLYNKLKVAFKDLDYQAFESAYSQIANPDYVHKFAKNG